MAEINTPWGEKIVTQLAQIHVQQPRQRTEVEIARELELDREEAAFLLLFDVLKFTTDEKLQNFIKPAEYGLSEEQVRILQAHYQGNMEKLRHDLDGFLQSSYEFYFDA